MDKGHHRVYDPYHEQIVLVLRRKPWSNISEIIKELEKIGKEERVKLGLPEKGPSRKTVRKHLRDMKQEGKTWNIRSRYTLMEHVLGKSLELNRLVSKVLHRSRMENVDYAFVHNTAGCYFAFDPASAIDLVLAMTLHQQEAVRFAKGLFWLEDIVVNAMRRGHLSRMALSKRGINFELLSEGLKRSFGDTQLIVLAFGVNLIELLNFLKTRSGQALAGRMLEEKRDAILQEARRLPYSKREIGLIHSFSYEPL